MKYDAELHSRPDFSHNVMTSTLPLPPDFSIISVKPDKSRERSFYWSVPCSPLLSAPCSPLSGQYPAHLSLLSTLLTSLWSVPCTYTPVAVAGVQCGCGRCETSVWPWRV